MSDAAPNAPLVGRRVGRILVEAIVGRGGMGKVYAGFDETLGREVALKAIRSGHLNRESRSRFLREARVLSQLEHPHICKIYDYVEGDDGDFLVLELIRGENLRMAIAEGLSTAEKIRIAEQLAEVLVVAHAEGIVHRDLKPSNVMLTEDRDIKVLDFGLARPLVDPAARGGRLISSPTLSEADPTLDLDDVAIEDTDLGPLPSESRTHTGDLFVGLETRVGKIMGTVAYMSPEQARGESVTTASDMYSYGLLLQNLFTERRPYPSDLSKEEVFDRAQVGRPREVSGLDRDLTRLIERLEARAPAGRPTAREAAEQLRWIRQKPRRRVRTLLIAAMVVIAVAAGLKYTLDLQRERAAATREAETTQRVLDFIVGLFEVADPEFALGETIMAREILDRGSLEIAEELEDEPEIRATLMGTMGKVYHSLGLHDEALPLLEESLELRRSSLGEEHPEFSEALHDWAALTNSRGEVLDALADHRQALEQRRLSLGPDHVETAQSLLSLSSIESALGNYQVAEDLAREALAVYLRRLVDGDTRIAEAKHRVANIVWEKGDFRAAEVLHRELLDELREQFGEEHPRVADSMMDLASVLSELDRHEEAHRLQEQVLILRTRIYGDRHPQVAISLFRYAQSLWESGDEEASEAPLREALGIFRERFGDEHTAVALVIGSLGAVHEIKGELAEAEQAAREALDIYRAQIGDDSRNVGISLLNLARIHQLRGDFENAAPLLEEALVIYHDTLPEGHRLIVVAEDLLAGCWIGLGRMEAAEALLLRLHDALPEVDSAGDLPVKILTRLVELYGAWGKKAEEAEYREQLTLLGSA